MFRVGTILVLSGLGLAGLWTFDADAQPAQPVGNPPALKIEELDSQASILPYLTYLRDPSGQLTIADVTTPDYAGQFVAAGNTAPNFGITGDAVWVHFALANPQPEPASVILDWDVPSTNYVDLYTGPPTAGQQPTFATGARRPYATRPLPGRTYAFPLEVPPATTTDYYLRLKSDMPLLLTSQIWQPAAYHASRDNDEVAWGIVLGMLLLMCGYNLLLFFTLRDPMHLVLVGFGLLVTASSALVGGYAARWLPPNLLDSWPQLITLSTGLVIIAMVMLACSFLELRTQLPSAYRLLLGGLAVVGIAILLGAWGSLQLAFSMLIGVLLPILVIILIATIVRVRAGSRLALFFLLGQSVAILHGIVQSLSILGFGPRLPALPLLVPSDSLFLLVIMSLALADRVNLLRSEADRANAALLASEQRLNTYLDALPFSIQVHDAELKPLYINAAIRDLRDDRPPGWYEEQYEVWLREFPVVVAGTDQPYPVEQLPLVRAAKGEKAHANDLALPLPEGQVTLEAWAVPLRDDGGEVTAIVTAFQDITARRATEIELANYRETLEQRVAQRTSELAALNTSLAKRVAELTAINEVGRRVARISDVESTLGEVVAMLVHVFHVTLASISLFDAAQHTVQMAAMADGSNGFQAQFTGESFFYDPAHGLPIQQLNPTIIKSPAQLPGLPANIHSWLAEREITQVLAAPLVARDQIIGALGLLTDDPERVFTADELRVAQTIAGQVATAIDMVQLIDEARHQRDVAEALSQTATALSRNLDQQNVLGTILEQLDQVFACEGAAVSLVEGQELVTAAARGLSASCLGRRLALDAEEASLTVLRSKQPVIVEDIQASTEKVCCQDTQPIHSWLGAPLVSGGAAIGVLSLDSVQAGKFKQAQAGLLATFADQAAIAVTNARLYDRAQVTAVAGERSRLARDLHDAVTQTIFSASLIAGTLPARLPELSPAAQADVEMLQLLTRGALAEMRTLLLELRPEHLTDAPLEVLLAQLAQAFSGRTGVPASVHANCDPGSAPPYDVKIAFYRVAQEALNNVAKHAKAACVTMRYATRPGSVHLAVLDDGRGFAVESVGPEKLGLAIMRERAAAVGAQLTVDSEPGLGTHLFMVWNDENNTQTA